MELDPVSRQGLSDGAVAQLREAILEGRLKPADKLGENELSQTLGISRAPIREALLRLEQQGLVTSTRFRGKSVVTLSARDIEELVTLRVSLERLSWARSCGCASEDDLAGLENSVRDMQQAVGSQVYPKLVRMDIDFHDKVVLAARHRRLYAAWSAIKWQVALYLLNRRVVTSDYHEIIVEEHTELLRILRAGRPERAADAVEEHILTAYDRLKSSLPAERAPEAPEPADAGIR